MQKKALLTGRGPCPVNGSKRWSYSGHAQRPDFIISYGSPEYSPSSEWIDVGEAETGGRMYRRHRDESTLDGHEIQRLSLPSTSIDPAVSADISLRDRVYRSLLKHCPLTPSHRGQLSRRKLPFKKLKELLIMGSMPPPRSRPKIAQKIVEELGLSTEEVLTIPGFFINERKHLSIGGAQGILIPSFDGQNRIQGFQIRKNSSKEDQSRYTWLSSAARGGAGSGAPACFLGDQNATTVWVTEGTFKGASLLLNDWTDGVISVAGVGNVKSVLDIIQTLENVEQIIVVYDSDWNQKVGVLRGLAKLLKSIDNLGIPAQAMGWHASLGKGIDDALCNGLSKSDLYEITFEGVIRSSEPIRYSNPRLKNTDELPQWEPESDMVATLEELREETSQMVFDALRKPAGTITSAAANTGSGKTYASVRFGLPYTLQVYRNYTALEEVDVDMREHHGPGKTRVLYGRIAPPSDPKDRAAAKRYERAGCPHYTEMKARSERGHSPCAGCPLQPKREAEGEEKGQSEEKGLCPYWKQRRKTLENPPEYLLMVPQSLVANPDLLQMLPDQDTMELFGEFRRMIIDDCPNFFHHLTRACRIQKTDIEQWRTHPDLLDADEEHTELKQWIEGLLLLLNSDVAQPQLSKEFVALSGVIAQLEEPVCERIVEEEEMLPLKAVHRLSSWMARGGSVRVEGEKGQNYLTFLQPANGLLERFKHMTIVNLDATPDEVLLNWFAHLTDMRFEAPVMKRRFPRLIQVPDILWDRKQVREQRLLIQALTEHIHDHKGIVLGFKNKDDDEGTHLAIDGHFDHAERGLNCYSGAAKVGLVGHYALPIAELENQAWQLRELSKVRNKPMPEQFISGVFTETRHYTDVWRPMSREMHVSHDVLVEHMRRHQHTSGIVQGAARPRSFEVEVLVLSGEPLDGLPWDVPVELCSRKELNERLGLGLSDVELFGEPQELNEILKKRNEQTHTEALERFQGKIPQLIEYASSLGRTPAIRELRTWLSEGEGMVSQKWAYWAREQLLKKREVEIEESLVREEEKRCLEAIDGDVPRYHLNSLNIQESLRGTSESIEKNQVQAYEKQSEYENDAPSSTPLSPLRSVELPNGCRRVELEEDCVVEREEDVEGVLSKPLSREELALIPPLVKVRLGLADMGVHNGWNNLLIRQLSDCYEVAKELLYRFIGLDMPLGQTLLE